MELDGHRKMKNASTSGNEAVETAPTANELNDEDCAAIASAFADFDGQEVDVPAARPAYRETLLDDSSYIKQSSSKKTTSSSGSTGSADALERHSFGANSSPSAPLSEGDKAFASLFASPPALNNPKSLEEALCAANRERKILLVNIQKHDAFETHKLTRDVWRSEAVQGIISAFFSFWQRFLDHPEGESFCTLYKVDSFPHVCAVDPRTGRRLKVWSIKQICDPTAATSEFMHFAESKTATQIYASLGQNQEATSGIKRNSPKRALSETQDTTSSAATPSSSCSSPLYYTKTNTEAATGSEYATMNNLLKSLHLERVKRRTPSEKPLSLGGERTNFSTSK